MAKEKKPEAAKVKAPKEKKPAEKSKKAIRKKSAEKMVASIVEPAKPAAIPVEKKSATTGTAADAVPTLESSVVEIVVAGADIGLRAYYISERRIAMGWPGNEDSDWIEAERQLKEEARNRLARGKR